ncbi:MAG: regulatory protein RecX [Collinsella sp.]|nr:regulatory protein RecX [Collinsella sp.]
MPCVIDSTVELPARQGSDFPRRRRAQTALVILDLDDSSQERIDLPVRVARALKDECPLSGDRDAVVSSIRSIEERVCFAVLVDALSRRDHSSRELEEKLSLQGYRSPCVHHAIERAKDARFLDDTRFARYFIEERKRRGWGRMRIERDLRTRGIDPSLLLPGYPEEFFDFDDDLERALMVLGRKAIPATNPYPKLMRFLMGKGFSASIASDAVKRVLYADGDEAGTYGDMQSF